MAAFQRHTFRISLQIAHHLIEDAAELHESIEVPILRIRYIRDLVVLHQALGCVHFTLFQPTALQNSYNNDQLTIQIEEGIQILWIMHAHFPIGHVNGVK